MLYLDLAEEIVPDIDERSLLLLEINTFKGLVYLETFDYFSAIGVYNSGIELARTLKRKEDILGGNHMIGEIYKRCKEYDRSLEYFELAAPPIYENDTIVERHGWWNLNVGEVYLKLGKYNQAVNYYNRALEIWNKIDMTRGKGYTYNSFGELYFEMGNEKCVSSFQKAIENNTLMNNKGQIITSYIGLGKYYDKYQLNKVTAAEMYSYAINEGIKDNLEFMLVPALDFFIERPEHRNILNIPINELLEIRNNAFEKHLRKSSNQDIKIIEAMEKVRDAEQKEVFAKEKASLYQKMVLLFFGMIISIISLFWVVFNKNKKLNQNQNKVKNQIQLTRNQTEELDLVNEKLTKNNIILKEDISVKNNELTRSKEIIENIKDASKESRNKRINSIIRSELDESYWVELKSINNYRDQDFVRKMSELNADLSFNEITICCMIKENLSTKDIAKLKQSTPESIKVARSRIRKKIKLHRDRKLADFLVEL